MEDTNTQSNKPVCPKCPNPDCSNYGKEMGFLIGEPDVWGEYKCKKCNHSTRLDYITETSEEKCPYFGCESSDIKPMGKTVRDTTGKEYPLYQCMKCKKRFVYKKD